MRCPGNCGGNLAWCGAGEVMAAATLRVAGRGGDAHYRRWQLYKVPKGDRWRKGRWGRGQQGEPIPLRRTVFNHLKD